MGSWWVHYFSAFQKDFFFFFFRSQLCVIIYYDIYVHVKEWGQIFTLWLVSLVYNIHTYTCKKSGVRYYYYMVTCECMNRVRQCLFSFGIIKKYCSYSHFACPRDRTKQFIPGRNIYIYMKPNYKKELLIVICLLPLKSTTESIHLSICFISFLFLGFQSF